jgi:hypothetical protein
MKRPPLSTLGVVLGLCVFWTGLGSWIAPAAQYSDFLNLYTGAGLAHEGRFADLHSPEVQLTFERRFYPQLASLRPFVRPAFYAAFLSPLALVPFGAAFRVWIASQTVLLVACWIWAWRRFGPDALIFGALALPAPLGIASGQDCVFLLVALIAAYEFMDRGRDGWGGAALALMLFKFHLVLLWPVALVIQKRWRTLAGYAAMAAAEGAACLALGGPASIRSYFALLRNKNLENLSPSPALMISHSGLAANLNLESPAFTLGLIAVVVAAFLWAIRNAPLWQMFALTAVASEIVAPHVYGYDATLLLLPVWLTIFRSQLPAAKIAAVLFATPLPFGFALADKPWAIVSSASLLMFFLVLVWERLGHKRGSAPAAGERIKAPADTLSSLHSSRA